MNNSVDAAKTLGVDTFTMARLLRELAADNLRSLANDIQRGGEASRGDVDPDEWDARIADVWRLTEAAKLCDIDWQADVHA